MKLLDVLTSPWAIQPDKLREIGEIYATHLRGEKIDIGAVEARIGRPLANEPQNYDIVDGVAIVPLFGVIAKRMNLFSQISGGASTELAIRDLRAATADPNVKAIILHIDSPGGTVDGTQQLAAVVRQVAQEKPVSALADGTMASAAYWVGSAAQSVYITDKTTQVGSIGVVATHVDVSAAEQQRGIKTTEIFAGKYKRISSQYGPLTESGKQVMQDQVDYLYQLFVESVADHRSVSVDKVLSDMADGRVFIGQQAIDAGLVDGVSTMSELIAQMTKATVPAGVQAKPTTPQKEKRMDLATLKKEHPDLAQALIEEGFAAGKSEGEQLGATNERARILGIEAHAMPGHEALIATLKADGKTNPDQAAAQVLVAEKGKLKTAAAALASDAPLPVPAAAEPASAVKPQANDIAVRAGAIVTEAKAAGRDVSYAAAAAQAARELAAQ
jgi:capsid assembly protease